MEILFLNPVLKETIWGGTRLKEYQCKLSSDHVGECWAISGHPNGDGSIVGGTYDGKTLSWLWQEHRELFDSIDGEVFPLLTKIIDANQDLSIQVHPDNAYAREHENGALGKTECWYVLDCEENATIIIGHNAKTREEMVEMIEEKRWKDFLREIPIHKGDFFQIEPGTLHAIKGGTLILETQQNSDVTYRVYDYDRLSNGKPRELHLQKSMDVITVPYQEPEKSTGIYGITENTNLKELVSCPFYTVWMLDVTDCEKLLQDQHFMLASVVEGEGTVEGIPISKGSHFILPKGIDEVVFHGTMQLILSAVS